MLVAASFNQGEKAMITCTLAALLSSACPLPPTGDVWITNAPLVAPKPQESKQYRVLGDVWIELDRKRQ
jgi:hypothetical protein